MKTKKPKVKPIAKPKCGHPKKNRIFDLALSGYCNKCGKTLNV